MRALTLRVLSLLSALLLGVLPGAWAQLGRQFQVDNLWYVVTREATVGEDEKEAMVLQWTSRLAPEVTIPAKAGGYRVVGIRSTAFPGCTMRQINIPASVKVIETGAFRGSSQLERVVIEEGLEIIGAEAFDNCPKLEKIVLPRSVKRIGTPIFKTARFVQQFEVHADNPHFMAENGSLYSKDGRELYYQFLPQAVRELKVRPGVEVIHPHAGAKSQLQRIDFPAGLKRIGYSAFLNSSELETVDIPEGIELIDSAAFYEAEKLRIDRLPEGLKKLGYSAFNKTNITRMHLPNSLEEIGWYAFSRCYSLKTLILGSGVKKIDPYIVEQTPKPTVIVLSAEPPKMVNWLNSTTNPGAIYVPAASIAKYRSAPWWSGYASCCLQAIELKTTPETLRMEVGEEQTVTASIVPAQLRYGNGEWRVHQPKDYVSIRPSLADRSKVTIKALEGGRARVEYRALGTEGAVCEVVVVKHMKSITFTPSSLTIAPGAAKQLSFDLDPADVTDPSLTWETSDGATVSVSPTGLIRGLKEGGPVTITATSVQDPTVKGSCTITVSTSAPPVVEHRVIFDLDGGMYDGQPTIPERMVADQERTPEPDRAKLSKDGHSFKHWVDVATGQPYVFTALVVKALTLKAVWEPMGGPGGGTPPPPTATEYTVTFVLAGGELAGQKIALTRTVERNKPVVDPGVPTKDGYTFKGWFRDGEEYNFSLPVTEDFTLTAKWEAKPGVAPAEYTVTFVLSGGELPGKTSTFAETVQKGKEVADPGVPTRAGYEFLGWFLGTEQYVFSKPVMTDITIVAKWKAVGGPGGGVPPVVERTVLFVLAGGELKGKVNVYVEKVQSGKPVADPGVPTRDGHTFKGWFKDGKAYEFSTPVTEDITIEAQWESTGGGSTPAMHTVLFVVSGGQLKGQADVYVEKVQSGKPVADPGVPMRDGHEFLGWFKDGKVYEFSTPVTADIRITAMWKPTGGPGGGTPPATEHTVLFVLAGGELKGKVNVYVEKVQSGKPVADPGVPTRDGHTFKGWFKDGKAYEFSTPVTVDITIEAQWESTGGGSTPAMHTVLFVVSGGQLKGQADVYVEKVQSGKAVADPGVPTRDGHEFLGWFKDGKVYEFSRPVTADIRITAMWKPTGGPGGSTPPATEHKVTFNLDGGLFDGSPTIPERTVANGQVVTEPERAKLSRPGHRFIHWVDAATGQPYVFSEPVTKSLILTAVWELTGGPGGGSTPPAAEHKVTFELDGGALGSESGSFTRTVAHGKAIDNPGTPTKDGHEFEGWFLGAEEYQFSASVMADITLMARWKATGGSGSGKGSGGNGPKGELLNPSPVESASQPVLTVFPNPAMELIVVEGLTERTVVQIYSLQGKLVYAGMLAPAARLDVRDLQPSSYLLRINDQTLRFMKK